MTTFQAASWLHSFSNVRKFNVYLKLSGRAKVPNQQWILPPRFLEALVQTCKRARRLVLHVRDNGAENSAERLTDILTPLKQLPVTCRLLLTMADESASTAFLEVWRETGEATLKKAWEKEIAKEGEGKRDQDGHPREWQTIEAMGQGR